MKKKKLIGVAAATGVTAAIVAELIIGAKNWRPIEDAPEHVQLEAQAQVQLKLSTGYRCTGSMVASNILLTNNHCVPYSKITTEATADGDTWFTCDTLLHTSVGYDYSLVLCEHTNIKPLEFDNDKVVEGEAIYVLHSNCDYYDSSSCKVDKLFSPGVALKVTASTLTHDGDTLGGSSGAPILKGGKIVALHNAGSGNDGNGRGDYNLSKTARGILKSMPSIYRDRLKYHGEVLPDNLLSPNVPRGSAPKPFKKTFWQKVKCFFSRRC